MAKKACGKPIQARRVVVHSHAMGRRSGDQFCVEEGEGWTGELHGRFSVVLGAFGQAALHVGGGAAKKLNP